MEEQAQQQEQQQQQRPRDSRRKQYKPLMPQDPALERLHACASAADLRAWRAALEGEGRFGADQLALLMRVLGHNQQGLGDEERTAYLRELLGEAAQGAVALNGKAAAYLLWAPAKLELRGSDPDVQAVVPTVFQHIDTMQGNDVSSTLWACGILEIQPSDEAKEQLVSRLQDLLPVLKMKELTAAGVGLTRLGMPPAVTTPLVAAFEAKVVDMPELNSSELERIVRLLPHLPGLKASSPFSTKLFEQLLRKARSIDLYALTEAIWAAGRLEYPLSEPDLQRLLRCAEKRLGENHGVQVQALLYGLRTLGCRAGKGALTHEFLEKCLDSQLQALERRAAAGTRQQAANALKALVGRELLGSGHGFRGHVLCCQEVQRRRGLLTLSLRDWPALAGLAAQAGWQRMSEGGGCGACLGSSCPGTSHASQHARSQRKASRPSPPPCPWPPACRSEHAARAAARAPA